MPRTRRKVVAGGAVRAGMPGLRSRREAGSWRPEGLGVTSARLPGTPVGRAGVRSAPESPAHPGRLWVSAHWNATADCRARAVRIPIRGGGEDMTRRKLSHVVAAGILAVLLVLPGPALAQSTHHRSSTDLWSWLASLWNRGVSSLGSGSGLGLKQGLGIDPNGGSATGSGGTTESTTTGSKVPGDQGHGIDPNG